MRALSREKKLSALTLLQHGRSTCEVSKSLGISQSTCFRILQGCALHVKCLREGHPRSFISVQRQACIRTITLDGLDIVVDVKNALTKQLNMVVCTNTVWRTLHEAGLESLEKQKKSPLTAKKMHFRLEFAKKTQRFDCV